MTFNHWSKIAFCAATLLISTRLGAQTEYCKDSIKHRQLHDTMWALCSQEDAHKVYAACWNYRAHCIEEKDNMGYFDSWVCGIMYNLDRMNISNAYHITNTMREELQRRGRSMAEEQFLAPKMLGHVYNACGNIPGALAEFEKAIELIKGTRYEAGGLSFLYLGMAHIQLNNDTEETLKWLDKTLEELARHQDHFDYWRGMADAYAMKAIVMFKHHNYAAFQHYYQQAVEASERNNVKGGDIFLPYARIYKSLLDGHVGQALKAVEVLVNVKERYLVRCDIYRYLGDNEKAFLTQRELMHKRDSITGVMIAENIQKQEEEMVLLKNGQKTTRMMNIVLVIAMVMAIMLIVGLALTIYGKRRYQDMLLKKNRELKSAYKQVAAADEMKTEFIRSVSHEIRTPLNIINGFTQVLTDDNANFSADERQSLGDTISKNTRQITSLVNKMLALANEHTKDLMKEVDDTDALDICHKALSAMPDVDPDRVKVELVDMTNGSDRLLRTNSDSLLQMLGNILENAVKFTEDGYIRLTLKKDKTYFHFTIEDSGCGIPADKVDTIFERFTKVDAFKEGLGLGLAYCHETVEKLGGKLTLDHTSEHGTAFTISLPIELKTV